MSVQNVTQSLAVFSGLQAGVGYGVSVTPIFTVGSGNTDTSFVEFTPGN